MKLSGKDNSAANMNILIKFVINILMLADFSEFTKAKNLSISGKQIHEGCLEKVIKNV